MLKEQMDAAIAHLEAEVRERFPGGRLLKHTFSVAETCRETARRLGRSDTAPEAAYLAGLAHDLFKDRGHDKLRELVRSESVPIDRHSWLLGGGLLHAPAAAHYLRSRLGVRDAGLLAAVYYHTTGRAGAGVLERILFCADYLDASRPKRSAEPGLESLRNKLKSSLDEVYGEVIRRKLVYTLSKGRPLHPSGVAAWNELCALKP
ncbi:MAG: bis(5'-nucleosyl)-tetraphosphatase (symmetrical) YqeK [Candidatus Glassbacteria bacterium]|nr:bis(5'-nucleosyl)-tetraphosphatase (symmetrical) YqeK [Candidatus Glassbacteria bacterium]